MPIINGTRGRVFVTESKETDYSVQSTLMVCMLKIYLVTLLVDRKRESIGLFYSVNYTLHNQAFFCKNASTTMESSFFYEMTCLARTAI